jgi:Uma2 family endonuclease
VAFRAHGRTEKPLALGEWDEPQPDIAVVLGGWRDYLNVHPTPEQVLLVMQIADTTREFDLGRKADVYAAAGIKDYWVVCPGEGEVVVCRDRRLALTTTLTSTTEWTYAERRVVRRGEVIVPLHAGAAAVAVADLLP